MIYQDHHRHESSASSEPQGFTKSKKRLSFIKSKAERSGSLFPVVPVLSPLSMQVSYQQSSSVGGSTEELDEPHPALSIPASKKQSRKHSLNSTSSTKSDYNRAGSFDSVLESVPDGSPLQTCREHPETTSDKKVPIRGPVRTRACSAEDEGVRRQPELGRVQSMIDYGEQMANNRHKSCERKVSSENFVLTHLDPQIDNRSALRPSLLKKKKTLGILFSFNTMLSKKREKIQKETAKLKSEQEKSHY